MAERSLLQYQPITGPVWREPVAEKLAWLPSDRYAGRALARAALRDWSIYPLQPPVSSYNPNVLDWQSRDRYAGKRFAGAPLRDTSVYPPQPFAVVYNPNGLEWLAQDRYAGRAAPRGRLDWSEPNQPGFVYDLVDWLPQGQQPVRALTRALLNWSVYPLQPVAVSFDPSTLGWLPSGTAPQTRVERRRLGDFVQPPFVALYRPDGLQWTPIDRYVARTLPRALVDWSVYPPRVVVAVYDPQTLEWLPQGRQPRVAVELRHAGDFQQPPFAALYRPERLQWIPSARYAGRRIPHWLLHDYVAFLDGLVLEGGPAIGYLVATARIAPAMDAQINVSTALTDDVRVSPALDGAPRTRPEE